MYLLLSIYGIHGCEILFKYPFFSRDCDEKICLEIERGLMEKVLLG